MAQALEFFLLQGSFLAVVLLLHTYLGLHIIRRTLIFSDLVLDQLAAFGMLVGVSFGIGYGSAVSYLCGALGVIVGALLLALLRPGRSGVPREGIIGMLYAASLVASLLLADKLMRGSSLVAKTLGGSLLWVNWTLVAVTSLAYLLLIAFHWFFRERFIALAEGRVRGVREGIWDFLLFLTQGVITVLVVPVAGVLLAYALLMIPAGTAALLRKDWMGALALGWGFGWIGCLGGICLSYAFDLPYSPTLILAMGAFFLGAAFYRFFKGARENGRV